MADTTQPLEPASPALAASPDNNPGKTPPMLVHRRMAAAIQNVTVDLMLLAREPHSRIQTLRDLSIAGRILHEQAAAIGVPANWIDYARQAGQEGRKATGTSSLPPRRPVSRSLLIAQLHHQADTLWTLAAVGPVRRDHGQVSAPAAQKLDQHLRLQWLRVAMVATAINLTEAETRGWWATDPTHWHSRQTQIQQQSPPDQGRQWRELTHFTSVREARVRVAAMRMVGIDLTASSPHQLPPAPHLLAATAENAWHTASLESEGGARIDAAIAATGVDDVHGLADSDTHDLPPPTRSAQLHAEPDF
ncbi:hypothetical protein BOX37_28300 [Nocardia mangyaensis]|uniref:Uncharacterized protein n=1 Tax=Nocardia mangyaensis TaxID=2213200 RepID=A0A1J0VYP4_9NOCA|nr:hypothetical protein [Nocardia mangyaensis]APE37187.1 hypothetical protein BOX37_28300 [Nocardia mangyaensis]MBC7299390.1 hypothetical protein [Nocardia sp.]